MTLVEQYFDATLRSSIDRLVADIKAQGFGQAEMSVALSLAFSQLSVHVNRHLIIAQRNHEKMIEPLRAELAELMMRKADELASEMGDAAVLAEVGQQ